MVFARGFLELPSTSTSGLINVSILSDVMAVKLMNGEQLFLLHFNIFREAQN